MNHFLQQAFKRIVHELLKLTLLQVAVLFVTLAVLVSVVLVSIIDLLWDGRFSAELQFAGVVVPFVDGLLIVGFLVALLSELREEVRQRKVAEDQLRKLSEELDAKVQERTQQLLAAQEEMVRKEKLVLLGQVADTVGHELRNPLGVMNNAVYFLQAVLADADETTREYLGIIKDEIADAERIVSDLLDAVRTKPPHPDSVNLAALLPQTLRKCNVPSSITVHLDIPETIPAIRVDPMHMHQVFWNLITNAVEAMPAGGVLEIRAGEDPAAKTVTVSIKDSGCGIAPEHQASLFQPMFTTKARRIGLGLVVVKNLTQVNGGSVAVASVPGKGSTFTVTLPGES
jgi:signal transduction histidine kinase